MAPVVSAAVVNDSRERIAGVEHASTHIRKVEVEGNRNRIGPFRVHREVTAGGLLQLLAHDVHHKQLGGIHQLGSLGANEAVGIPLLGKVCLQQILQLLFAAFAL